MTIKSPCGVCEKLVANSHQAINYDKCGLWIHTKCDKNSHWYCMLCTKMFLSFSDLIDNEFKQIVIKKQLKFNSVNSENNITKYFTIKDLNYTFNDVGNLFSLFHLNINLLSFHFDEFQSLIPKSKNDFQIITTSQARLKKLRKQ